MENKATELSPKVFEDGEWVDTRDNTSSTEYFQRQKQHYTENPVNPRAATVVKKTGRGER